MIFTSYTPLDPTQLSNVKIPVDPSGGASRDGNVVAMVGNVYLAVSKDAGATFDYFDPSTMFPTFAGGIVGDQQLIYVLEFDLFVWIMLHSSDPASGDGAFRLAAAKSDDVADKPKTAWSYYDFVSSDFDESGSALDQPHLSHSGRFLIIAIDVGGRGRVVIRIPLTDLASGSIGWQWIGPLTVGSSDYQFSAPANGDAPGTFMAGHIDTANLRVVEWRDSTSNYATKDVAVAKWSDSDDYSCTSPSGIDWSSRCGSRISGATWRDGQVWFSWTSPRSKSGDSPNYPQPYTRVVAINANTFTVASEMQVWNDNYVFAYSALAVNSNGEVAIAVAWGGASDEADTAFGILGDFVVWYRDGSTATTPGTTPGRWGDFLRTYPCFSTPGHLDGFGYFTNTDAGGSIVQNPYHVRYGR
ncbi:hypothetical protein [Mycolicibacterium stellerae]|uniref:hypothetical protein n=1 Tax=Mycolicibacterium stellerae TaxID=2358193 RepID=UPI000F0B85C7|nr:hypothetical protein [Mycolicibacterium stellerae]